MSPKWVGRNLEVQWRSSKAVFRSFPIGGADVVPFRIGFGLYMLCTDHVACHENPLTPWMFFFLFFPVLVQVGKLPAGGNFWWGPVAFWPVPHPRPLAMNELGPAFVGFLAIWGRGGCGRLLQWWLGWAEVFVPRARRFVPKCQVPGLRVAKAPLAIRLSPHLPECSEIIADWFLWRLGRPSNDQCRAGSDRTLSQAVNRRCPIATGFGGIP